MADFDSVLAEVAEQYRQATPFEDFTPPDGDYTVMLNAIQTGVKEEEGKPPYIWISVKGQLLCPNDLTLDRKVTSLGFFSTATAGRQGMFKGFVKSLLPPDLPEGEELVDVDDIKQSIDFLTKQVENSLVVNIQVKTNPKGYPNIKVLNVAEEVEPEAQPAEEATAAEEVTETAEEAE